MQKTNIEYLTHSWSPIAMKCNPVSEGCAHCWHIQMANRMAANPKLSQERRNAYSGGKPALIEKELNSPIRRKRPAIIGVQFMGDLFHRNITPETQVKIFKIMEKASKHVFLILTKRPKWARHFYTVHHDAGNIQNIWLGVTAENQEAADERIPILLQIPAAVRFVSLEPLLEKIDLDETCSNNICWRGDLDWVIVGGETGPGARPMHPEWARSIRDQCQQAMVPFFFKQWGEWLPSESYRYGWYTLADGSQSNLDCKDERFFWNKKDGFEPAVSLKVGKKAAGRMLDGKVWSEMPNT